MWLLTCDEGLTVERLMSYLGVIPGAVTPFAVINDNGFAVQMILDVKLIDQILLNFHPLDNAMTTQISSRDLLLFLASVGHRPIVVDFERGILTNRGIEASSGNPSQPILGLTPDQCAFAVLRGERYKYIHFTSLPALLFDLEKDPGEFDNLAQDPAHRETLASMAQRMLSWRMSHVDRCLANTRITPEGGHRTASLTPLDPAHSENTMSQFQPFVMEHAMGKWETMVEYNLSESGVHPVTVRELLEESGDRIETLLNTELNYPQVNGNPGLRAHIAATYTGAEAENVLVTVGAA